MQSVKGQDSTFYFSIPFGVPSAVCDERVEMKHGEKVDMLQASFSPIASTYVSLRLESSNSHGLEISACIFVVDGRL